VYSVDEHLDGKNEEVKDLALAIQDFITGIDSLIQEVPKKNYIANKSSQNIVCMEIQNQRVLLFLKLDPKEVVDPPKNSKDMTGKGHYGSGDFGLSIKSMDDFEASKKYIEMAHHKVGG